MSMVNEPPKVTSFTSAHHVVTDSGGMDTYNLTTISKVAFGSDWTVTFTPKYNLDGEEYVNEKPQKQSGNTPLADRIKKLRIRLPKGS